MTERHDAASRRRVVDRSLRMRVRIYLVIFVVALVTGTRPDRNGDHRVAPGVRRTTASSVRERMPSLR